MKRSISLFVFFLFAIYCYGQDHIKLTLDYSADRDEILYPQYGAAYLVNSSEYILGFIANWTGLWNDGQVYCYGNMSSNLRRSNDGIMEVTFEPSTYGEAGLKIFALHPGEKVKIFSKAFTEENRLIYPFSELIGAVYVNDRQVRWILAYLNPKLFK